MNYIFDTSMYFAQKQVTWHIGDVVHAQRYHTPKANLWKVTAVLMDGVVLEYLCNSEGGMPRKLPKPRKMGADVICAADVQHFLNEAKKRFNMAKILCAATNQPNWIKDNL